MAVVIQRRKGPKPFRVVDGQERLTGWCSTWDHVVKVATERDWSGEVIEVEGEEAEDPVLRTRGGFALDEAASALQKTIRRGREVEAMHWAMELARSGFHRYVWKRLAVIAAEDVGFANPDAAVQVDALWRMHQAVTEKQPTRCTELLGMAVLLLSRSPKSQLVGRVMFLAERLEDVEVPDYALDVHTRRGRQMGRDLEHFFTEGAQLVGEVAVGGDEYRQVDDMWMEER